MEEILLRETTEGITLEFGNRPQSSQQNVDLSNYVQKVPGKGLSTYDYTAEDKQKVNNFYVPDISGKVDKVTGKQLSTEDFTTLDKQKLDGLYIVDISNKVDKVAGKGLSEADFSAVEKAKLATLNSVDVSYQSVTYSPSISRTYNSLRPNFFIPSIAGNISVSVTGTNNGFSGSCIIQRGAGSETITLNGTVVIGNYPTAAGALVRLTYRAEPVVGLCWYCDNPTSF